MAWTRVRSRPFPEPSLNLPLDTCQVPPLSEENQLTLSEIFVSASSGGDEEKKAELQAELESIEMPIDGFRPFCTALRIDSSIMQVRTHRVTSAAAPSHHAFGEHSWRRGPARQTYGGGRSSRRTRSSACVTPGPT